METKVPFYNVVNIFLPGLVFTGSCILLFLDDFKHLIASVTAINSTGLEVLITVSCFAIAYEIGYIIFRGAKWIEKIFAKTPIWTKYDCFVATKKAGATSLDILSREYGFARTQITLFILLSILTGLKACWILLVLCILCIALFLWTACGHMIKIKKTVSEYLMTDSANEVASND